MLKWFSENTEMIWWKFFPIMATFVQTCKFDDFIQYDCCGCGYTDQNGVFFLCSCTVTKNLYQCISLDNIYHCMSKSMPFWEMFFLFWVFPPCIAVLVCLLVKATGNWDSEHHLLLLLCLLLTYKYKTIKDGGITVHFLINIKDLTSTWNSFWIIEDLGSIELLWIIKDPPNPPNPPGPPAQSHPPDLPNPLDP